MIEQRRATHTPGIYKGIGASTPNTSISIAMALYNGQRFVREQLESFARQTRLPDELVVSDDASTDRGVAIVHEFARNAPFSVRILANHSNLGCTKNFERAIRECTGDIICTSDWDDVWHPEKLALLEQALAGSPAAGIATGRVQRVDEQLRPVRPSLPFEVAWRLAFSPWPWCRVKSLAEGNAFNHSLGMFGNSMAFRAKFKPLILPLPDTEEFRYGWWDFFVTWAILCSGAAVVYVDRELVKYRLHAHQMSRLGQDAWVARMRRRLSRLKQRPLVPQAFLIERLESPVASEFCENQRLKNAVLMHWRARCYLPVKRRARIAVVLRELISLRYHRFSSGFLTALKDLLFVK